MDAHLIALPLQASSAVRLGRMSRKWTQKQLAEKAGVSERLVNALEAGDAKGIRLDKLMAIYGALDMRLFAQRPYEREQEEDALKKEMAKIKDVPFAGGGEAYRELEEAGPGNYEDGAWHDLSSLSSSQESPQERSSVPAQAFSLMPRGGL
jgi:transcriptional regulator with XRE-family HTH domain